MEYAKMRELNTPRLRLRRLVPEDAPVYFERIGRSTAVTKYMLWNPHTDISESEASIQKALRRYEEGKCYRWGIALRTDCSLIGVIELLKFNEIDNTCSFAYMLGEDFWNKGYGTEAVKAAFAFAFTELKVSAIHSDHFSDNPASGAVMRKAGMRFQGTVRDKYEKNGRKYDADQYQITASEWLRFLPFVFV